MKHLILVMAVVVNLAFAQISKSQEPSSNPPASSSSADAKAADAPRAESGDSTIIFFREGHFAGSALKPSIYLDGKELDRLANGHWFSVHTPPGKHEIQSSAKNEPATVIETKAGETIYVQMVVVTGTWRGAGRLMQVSSADAQKVIAKLKPLHE